MGLTPTDDSLLETGARTKPRPRGRDDSLIDARASSNRLTESTNLGLTVLVSIEKRCLCSRPPQGGRRPVPFSCPLVGVR
jgi:hypothetical protein